MMRCPTCSAEMRPLLLSWYCPKDCDRPKAITTPWVKAEEFTNPVGAWAVRSPHSLTWTLSGLSHPPFDMTSHIWVTWHGPAAIGVQFSIAGGMEMYKNPTVTKRKPYAICLSGIDGSAFGWIVPRSSYMVGVVAWCEGPIAGLS